ncbi:hypothetical protein K491DRAFT_375985 [Lophiostoma macrostomum CBS 122681]|uniref:Uncharacterized protein n=1 Tax=Lophiostoma macrostomum CBS 122681 TaxID=1314788 RepID=A0A6A6TCC8_9PLEO|nr:hypothetical protein K491DRAFT_375985 [Lophiostoma macrostomum CBS 122681]
MQNSIFDSFIILATLPSPTTPGYHNLPGMDQPDLLLNILEMWCCLLFRSLPRQTLETYLPPTSLMETEQAALTLNIATPLDHGDKAPREFIDLSYVQNPIVQEYVRGREIKDKSHIPSPEKREKSNRVAQVDVTPGAIFVFGTLILLGYCLLKSGTGSPPRPRHWR